MVAAKLAKLEPGRPEKPANLPVMPTQAQAAEMLNVSERAVRSARVVQQEAIPEIAAAVEAGALAICTAAEIATLPHPA